MPFVTLMCQSFSSPLMVLPPEKLSIKIINNFAHGANYRNRTNNLRITGALRCQLRQIGIWWRLWDSNPRPSACRADALSAELNPHNGGAKGSRTPVPTVTVWNDNRYTMAPVKIFMS